MLQLFIDEQTKLKHRQRFSLSSLVVPDIYFTTNVVFDIKRQMVGNGGIWLPYLDSATSNIYDHQSFLQGGN
jgi:hypothetical protein